MSDTAARGSGSTTIRDVARHAGVSKTTVSRVLNEPESVSPETRERVMQTVRSLNFAPSRAARDLRKGRTDTIALLVGDISQPFHGRLAKAVTHTAEAGGVGVMLIDLDHNEQRLVLALHRLAERGIDGVIISTADDIGSDAVQAAVAELTGRGVPVAFGPMTDPADAARLSPVYAETARLATGIALRSGLETVLVVGTDGTIADREVEGYRAAVEAAGARPLVLEGAYSFDAARAAIADHLRAGRPLTGVVAMTAPMALGALRAVQDAGLAVPGDVAIVVTEDVPLNDQVHPALTSVGVDPWENGVESARVLLGLREGVVIATTDLPIRVRERGTTV